MIRIFSKKRWPLVLIMGALASLAFVLLYPGNGGSAPLPETLGRDQIFYPSEMGNGGFVGTSAGQPAQRTGAAPAGSLALEAAAPAAQGDYTSDELQADFPFNALGMHWLAQVPDGASVNAEVRFSQDGSNWGDWQPVPRDDAEVPDDVSGSKAAGETIGELVFTDAARFYQYRLNLTASPAGQSPEVTRVTASYIDSVGYGQSPLSLAFISSLPARALAFLTPSRGDATPAIITRAQWGANESWMTWDHQYAPVKKEIIHHTAGSNDLGQDYAATVRGIYYYHAVSNGWGDIGYNYLIDPYGRVYEGRSGGPGVVGGHAYGWNVGSVGISVIGNYDTTGVTPASYNALVDLASSLAITNNINPVGNDYFVPGGNSPNFLGHNDTSSTACPGAKLYQHLNGTLGVPQLRNDAAARFSPHTINAPFKAKWDALGGAPGYATGDAFDVTGGKAQNFASGRLIWDAASGNVFWVVGSILAEYDSLGANTGFLGMPTSDEYGVATGRVSDFAGGKIYYSDATGAHYVMGGILGKYLAVGGPGGIGFPTADEADTPGVTATRESAFQWGRIYWDAVNDSHAIYGGILAKYLEWGGPAVFGVPIADEHDVTGKAGARQSDFAGGWFIYWSASTGAHALCVEFITELDEWGGPAGYLGLPTSDAMQVPTGFWQDFEGGIITRDYSANTYVVYGGIAAKYRQLGGPAGALGIATADEKDAPGVAGARESDFVSGRIYWSNDTGATGVYGAILYRYIQLGASAAIGIPLSDEHAVTGVTGGRQSDFQYGTIYYTASTGAWEAYGAIAGKWYELGGPSGYMGMPVNGEVAAGSGRMSEFQRGRVYWSETTGAHAVYGSILAKYLEVGGPGDFLGLPTSDEYADGPQRRSDFFGGYITWDASSGAIVHII